MSNFERRLGKLEAAMAPPDEVDLAGMMEAGRRRAATVPPDVIRQEQRARLAEMEARHAEKPLRGLALLMLEGRRRSVTRQDARDAG